MAVLNVAAAALMISTAMTMNGGEIAVDDSAAKSDGIDDDVDLLGADLDSLLCGSGLLPDGRKR